MKHTACRWRRTTSRQKQGKTLGLSLALASEGRSKVASSLRVITLSQLTGSLRLFESAARSPVPQIALTRMHRV